jgi:SSS family solute:Na+ symporter
MHQIDWFIAFIPVVIAFGVAIYTQRYAKSVADFMSGGRMAGRYVLAIAGGELQAGAVVFVALFEMIGKSGFVVGWWGALPYPIFLLIGVTGYVTYRFREMRVMTLAQFFEIRYSKAFRLFTGGLGFFAGICNFGIIPAVGARFLVYFLGLPVTVHFFSYSLPGYIPLMAVLLSATLLLAISGGLVTVMVTNCIEGIMSQLFYMVIIVGLLAMFHWPQIFECLAHRAPGHSLLNPFDAGKITDFNIWYVLMGIFGGFYGTMAWQNASGYNSAAFSPQESRMGGLLGRVRDLGKGPVITLLALCAVTFLNHPDFSAGAQAAHAAAARIQQSDIRRQMELPIAVAFMLPTGIKGLLCAVLLMGVFGGDATHLHSWGGIFVQDILVPLRKKPFTPKQHIFALRASMAGVAVFAFLFGALFRQTEYVVMWFTVTTAIFVGGAGSAIVGGMYWKKGTTPGAWAAMITGSGLATGGILARQAYGDGFPLNGAQISFFSNLIAVSIYIVVSLLTYKKDFNLDRMLHRGQYALPDSVTGEASEKESFRKKLGWTRLLGFDENYSRKDKWIAGGLMGWSLFWSCVVAVGTVWNLISPWPLSVWSQYWHFTAIILPITAVQNKWDLDKGC